jgi:hypothetical protein
MIQEETRISFTHKGAVKVKFIDSLITLKFQ